MFRERFIYNRKRKNYRCGNYFLMLRVPAHISNNCLVALKSFHNFTGKNIVNCKNVCFDLTRFIEDDTFFSKTYFYRDLLIIRPVPQPV